MKHCLLFSLTHCVDFSHLFDWNTKQLFVLLLAHYRTETNVSQHHISTSPTYKAYKFILAVLIC